MIVIRYRRVLISLILIFASTALLFVCGIIIYGGKGWALKPDAQNYFFWGFVILIFQLFIGVSLILSHRRVINLLKRISKIENLRGSHAGRVFNELGELGDEIKNMLKVENDISMLRADRISALNNLISMIIEDYSAPVMVTDISGDSIMMSAKLKNSIIKEKDLNDINNICDIRSDININEVLNYMEKQKTFWSFPQESALICTPIFDRRSNIEFCIWEFETSFFAGKLKDVDMSKTGVKNEQLGREQLKQPNNIVKNIFRPFSGIKK